MSRTQLKGATAAMEARPYGLAKHAHDLACYCSRPAAMEARPYGLAKIPNPPKTHLTMIGAAMEARPYGLAKCTHLWPSCVPFRAAMEARPYGLAKPRSEVGAVRSHRRRNGGEALRPREVRGSSRFVPPGGPPQWRRGLTASRRTSQRGALPNFAQPQWRRGLMASRSELEPVHCRLQSRRNGGEALRPREGPSFARSIGFDPCRNGGEALRPREVVSVIAMFHLFLAAMEARPYGLAKLSEPDAAE